MQRVWPPPAEVLDDAGLEALYRYPAPTDGSWLAVNFVASIDGATEVDGRSAALSPPADRRIFALGHDLADVVLLGSGTAVGEDYPGIRPDEAAATRRVRHGLAPVPPLAVVSGSGSLPADATSIVDVVVPSIVIAPGSVARRTRDAWRDAGAEVIVAGDGALDLSAALRQLAERGLRRVDCEGGPKLVGALLRDDLVDELRVNVAPVAVGGGSSRVATTAERLAGPPGFELASLLVEDSTLLPRYVRPRG